MLIVFFIFGLALGTFSFFIAARLYAKSLTATANKEALELLQEAKEDGDAIFADIKLQVADFEEELREELEKTSAPVQQRITILEEHLVEKEHDLKASFEKREKELRSQSDRQKSFENRFKQVEQRFRNHQAELKNIEQKYTQSLLEHSGAERLDLENLLKHHIEADYTLKLNRENQVLEEEFEQEVEKIAKRTIETVIHRFQRAYCPERGIGNVDFKTLDILKKTIGENKSLLKIVERECGIDIAINEQYLSASVLGFDPVRRELGRSSLQRLTQERVINEQKIIEVVANCKRDLFRRIRNDGNKIAQELKLTHLSDEIRNMMGALRYRYSFAQNQYFHCCEVGFLCGLLSAELKLSLPEGRRAGMLHDIGKAMDHSIDGGHAVIGADFISKNGEKPPVVHAVRAHHHDEPPSTDLAFLVIASDAISGARPGARRSTIDSYSQKMADLENIGSSFDGVTNVYIMSAGREVRVIVDSHKVDDHHALTLSQSIAKRIEEECSYPGLIKVTVVREIQAIDYAK